jgi:hypothetical protein
MERLRQEKRRRIDTRRRVKFKSLTRLREPKINPSIPIDLLAETNVDA